MDYKEDF
jgi:hypothetical protein